MTALNKEPNDGYHKGDPKENKSTLHKTIYEHKGNTNQHQTPIVHVIPGKKQYAAAACGYTPC
ncbi:hypothetical protein A3860_25205 [Niastella vici]|uniref:Uncharacterized protein n=1 Tax=Niastella vici TaxID=1703345 RepID=A0A1V9FXT7_9BACT|nr:hypothetical protein A3860_25205 [Niastella vici]